MSLSQFRPGACRLSSFQLLHDAISEPCRLINLPEAFYTWKSDTNPSPVLHHCGYVIHPYQLRFQLRTSAIHYTDHPFILYKGEYALNPKPTHFHCLININSPSGLQPALISAIVLHLGSPNESLTEIESLRRFSEASTRG